MPSGRSCEFGRHTAAGSSQEERARGVAHLIELAVRPIPGKPREAGAVEPWAQQRGQRVVQVQARSISMAVVQSLGTLPASDGRSAEGRTSFCWHSNPVPVHPVLHPHVNEPNVFVQSAPGTWQLCVLNWHSSASGACQQCSTQPPRRVTFDCRRRRRRRLRLLRPKRVLHNEHYN